MEQLSYPEKVRRQIIEEKYKEKLLEDVEHFYFCCVGILTCAISNWQAALAAAMLTVGAREFLRWLQRRKEIKGEVGR